LARTFWTPDKKSSADAGKPIEFVAAKLKTFREGCYGSCLRTSNIAQTQTEAESEGE
jgi:hypothetical protein